MYSLNSLMKLNDKIEKIKQNVDFNSEAWKLAHELQTDLITLTEEPVIKPKFKIGDPVVLIGTDLKGVISGNEAGTVLVDFYEYSGSSYMLANNRCKEEDLFLADLNYKQKVKIKSSGIICTVASPWQTRNIVSLTQYQPEFGEINRTHRYEELEAI